MTLLGEKGLRELAMLNHKMAVQAADRLSKIDGVTLLNDSFFNEFTLILDKDSRPMVRALADQRVLGGVSLGRLYPEETVWRMACWSPLPRPAPKMSSSALLQPWKEPCHEHDRRRTPDQAGSRFDHAGPE